MGDPRGGRDRHYAVRDARFRQRAGGGGLLRLMGSAGGGAGLSGVSLDALRTAGASSARGTGREWRRCNGADPRRRDVPADRAAAARGSRGADPLGEPSVGRALGGWGPSLEGAQHVSFDLNDSQDPEHPPQVAPYDVVVMAEVIEHLYTAPTLVLTCVASWLVPGGRLVVQTPNAVALDKRVRLLCGRNPYESIRRTQPRRDTSASTPSRSSRRRRARPACASSAARWRTTSASIRRVGARSSESRACFPASLRDGITATFRRA